MSFSFSPKIVTDGLVLYLDAANTRSYVSGSTVWNDLSRRSITNGSLVGVPTFNSNNGGYFTFNGSSQYVNCGNTSLEISANTTQITLEAWVFPVSFTSYGGIISRVGGVSPFGGWMLNVNSDGSVNKFDLAINISGSWRTWVTGGGTFGTSLTTNNWYHIVGTYNGSTMEMYLNGVKYNSVSYPGSIQYTSVNNLYVGLNGGGTYFNGRVSQVKVYNRTLSSAEVLQNYNTTKSRFL